MRGVADAIRRPGRVAGVVALPLAPPVPPRCVPPPTCRRARAGATSPSGTARTLVFRDGDEVFLQSRNGKPLNRYFPEIVEDVLALPHARLVIDGEIVVEVDGVQEFDLLGQRIHPAASRVARLREETPASFVAFDLLAEDESLLPLPYEERRAGGARGGSGPPDARAGRRRARPRVAAGDLGRRGGQGGRGPIPAGGAHGDGEGEAGAHHRRRGGRISHGQGRGHGRLLILGLYDDEGELHVVGHTSGFTRRQKSELLSLPRALS